MNNPLRILQTLDAQLTAATLILTKMARGDENDLADIGFLLRHEVVTAVQLREAFQRARLPDVPEIQALFRAAQPRVLAMLKAE